MAKLVLYGIWFGGVVCWAVAAYYTIRFNAAFAPVRRAGWLPKGLNPRLAIFWADDPPECRALRLSALKWGAAFCSCLIAGMLLTRLS